MKTVLDDGSVKINSKIWRTMVRMGLKPLVSNRKNYSRFMLRLEFALDIDRRLRRLEKEFGLK